MTDTITNTEVKTETTLLTPVDTTVVDKTTVDTAKVEADAKTVADKEAAEKAAKDATGDKAKVGAPEKYEAFKLPEGVAVDEKAMADFLPVAKELGLTQDAAQKLIDLQTKYVSATAEAQQKVWKDLQTDWVQKSKTDKEYGGAEFEKNLGFAAKALKEFGTPELIEALDTTGTGNHPELVRAFVRIGKAMSEDKFHQANKPVNALQTQADRLFPNHPKT